jgi:xanthine dehydrogenase/oxidase
MPVLAADGCHVTTVEGIGSFKSSSKNNTTTQLHPVQQAMVDLHGSQCGYCTPGIIVSIYTLLTNEPSVSHLEEHLDGNLCRCTGYRPIWDAARSLCTDAATAAAAEQHNMVIKGPCGVPCRECPERDECVHECNLEDKQDKNESKQDNDLCCSSSRDKMIMYQDSFLKVTSWRDQANNMFPHELLSLVDDSSTTSSTSNVQQQLAQPLVVVDKTSNHAGGTWFKPTSLMELLTILDENHDSNSNKNGSSCKIVVGNTEVGIEMRFKQCTRAWCFHPIPFPNSIIST